MLINLRNALMAGKRLPYDSEVEYLESTGTQWIDTGISGAEQNLIITAGVRINTYSAYAGAFGNYASESANSFRLILTSSNNGQAYANCGYKTSSSHIISNFSLRNWHTVILNGAEDICFCDGVEYTKSNRYIQGTANTNTIKLFTSGGAASGTWSKQFSEFKVELNGTLLQDLIPVRKGTIGYMYDRVSGQLFGNAGTGDFVLGPDVVPVEYIESHGTEWIDTGFQPTSTTDAAITFTATQNNDSWVMGAVTWWGVRCFFNATPKQVEFANGSNATYRAGVAYTQGDIATLSLRGSEVFSDGVKIGEITRSNASSNLAIFGYQGSTGLNISGRVYSVKLWQSGALVRSFLPVRVGSGSTWEGAMMDVLTRRIYRNAGTGAFTYGNDLKYPIPAE